MTPEDKQKAAGKQFAHCTFAIAEYRATTYAYMHKAPSQSTATSVASMPTIAFGLELDFS